MPSSTFAVSSSPLDEQLAMSPAPTRTSEPAGGGSSGTPMTDVPTFPPALALMVADPAATAVTRPVEGPTVATALFDEVHANVVTEPGGLAAAVSCSVVPFATV